LRDVSFLQRVQPGLGLLIRLICCLDGRIGGFAVFGGLFDLIASLIKERICLGRQTA
jgi:hypothetical protein